MHTENGTDSKPISRFEIIRWAAAQGPLSLIGYSIAALFACCAAGAGMIILAYAYRVAFGECLPPGIPEAVNGFLLQ